VRRLESGIEVVELDSILDREGGWRFAQTGANSNATSAGLRPDTSDAAVAWPASSPAAVAAAVPAPPSQLAFGSVSSISSPAPASVPAPGRSAAPLGPSTEEIDSLLVALRQKPVTPMPLQLVEPPSHDKRR
jgi:hypothetical protein